VRRSDFRGGYAIYFRVRNVPSVAPTRTRGGRNVRVLQSAFFICSTLFLRPMFDIGRTKVSWAVRYSARTPALSPAVRYSQVRREAPGCCALLGRRPSSPPRGWARPGQGGHLRIEWLEFPRSVIRQRSVHRWWQDHPHWSAPASLLTVFTTPVRAAAVFSRRDPVAMVLPASPSPARLAGPAQVGLDQVDFS
jgi:hypothetical protein